MSFSTDLAKVVADQVSRFASLNRHQLAGQLANLDFWMSQVRHALSAIDGYGVRFVRLHASQEQYVATHGTVEFSTGADQNQWEHKPAAVRRLADRDLQKARRELLSAMFLFLTRCKREGLISDSQFSTACADLQINLLSGTRLE